MLIVSELDQYQDQITNTQIENLFEKFGGIPRYVLVVEAKRRDQYLEMLESDIVYCTLDVIRNVDSADIDNYDPGRKCLQIYNSSLLLEFKFSTA